MPTSPTEVTRNLSPPEAAVTIKSFPRAPIPISFVVSPSLNLILTLASPLSNFPTVLLVG